MARRTKIVVVPATPGNRDAGKEFLVTEMSARAAEKWAARLLLAMSNSGVDVPDGIRSAGFAGLAALGVRSLGAVKFTEAEPLLDEMMTCVRIATDKRNPSLTRPLIDDDVEEVSTLALLRMEVLELHLGFSLTGFLSGLTSEAEEPAALAS